MEKEELQKLFGEFLAKYNVEEHEAIWKKQSEIFRQFWTDKILNTKCSTIPKSQLDSIICILDAKAKGHREFREAGGEDVAMGWTTQIGWYGIFESLKNKSDIREAMDALFNAEDDEQCIDLINQLEKVNEINRNRLTGRRACTLNTLLFAYHPERYLSMVSLKHRLQVIKYLELGDPESYESLSYGERIIRTNRDILSKFKEKYGIETTPRTLTRFLYSDSIWPIWRKDDGKIRKRKIGKKKGKEEPMIPIEEKYVTEFLQILACSPPQPFQTETLKKLDSENKIIYNTEFQRGEVWDLPRKQKLIDSILRGYSINTIFLRQRTDGYECLDGQQRLKTILRGFLNNKFPINPKISPEFNRRTYFEELPESLKSKIKSYIIYAIIIYTNDDEETCKIFLRLQEGLPLNSAEKLNAMIGFLRNEIVELTRHPFMGKLGIKDYRFAHRYILAQVYLLTLRNQITDVKFRTLREIYGTYKMTRPPEAVTNTIKRTINFLDKQFGEETGVIKYNADFISLFLLAKYMLENYAINETGVKLKEFFIQFLTKVGQIESSGREEDAPYYDYKTYRKASADSRSSIEKRFNIILSKFLEFAPDIKPKDTTREFNYWEKLAVYWRDKGICQICSKKTPFEEGSVDHKIPHSKGGSTTIANGQWLCKKCNLEKLDKII